MLSNGSEPLDIEIIEKYYCKRNNVYKVIVKNIPEEEVAVMGDYDNSIMEKSDFFIMKKYSDKELMEKEYKNIKMLENMSIPVPAIAFKTHESLFLEYIQGRLVGDLVEREDQGDWIDQLALWMAKLHKIKYKDESLLKIDVNLRNFIYSGNKIYGLDFEEFGYGDPRRDLANICFFILTNRPSFTAAKHRIMRRFLESYERYSGIKLAKMGKYLCLSKKESKIRRNK